MYHFDDVERFVRNLSGDINKRIDYNETIISN